jgi:hypothetical protein
MNADRPQWSARELFGLGLFVVALLGAVPSAAQSTPAPTNEAVRITEARKANTH